MKNAGFTQSQAQDLARYFLDDAWIARNLPDGCLLRNSKTGESHIADTWRASFRAANIKLPFRARYVGIGRRVVLGNENVAVAASNSLAVRIAHALNEVADETGR